MFLETAFYQCDMPLHRRLGLSYSEISFVLKNVKVFYTVIVLDAYVRAYHTDNKPILVRLQ